MKLENAYLESEPGSILILVLLLQEKRLFIIFVPYQTEICERMGSLSMMEPFLEFGD